MTSKLRFWEYIIWHLRIRDLGMLDVGFSLVDVVGEE
jgi:hypothetical protein